MSADTPWTQTVPLTSRAGYESHPAIAPDGTWFAYQHYSKGDDLLQPDARQWDLWRATLARDGATTMGPERLTRLLQDAGFSRIETLDIKSQVNAFFVARP